MPACRLFGAVGGILPANRADRRRLQAQDWPQRPVRVIVPFAAGGNIDVMARLTCQRMSEAFGQQFVVENRVGGNGTIAAESVAHAAPDGYTLFWAGPAVVSIFPAITKAAYDPVKDFKPISVIGVNPQVLVVNAKLPVADVADFIAYVKMQPQRLPYAGGGGPGSLSNLLMALFLKRAGLEMTSVSYRGTAPAMTDLVAGHIPTMFVPLSEALPQAQAGNIRMLARVERRARPPGRASADHRRIRISRLPRRELERPAGARRHARRHRQPDRGRVRARRQGAEIRRAARPGRRRAAGIEPGRDREVHRRRHGAVGGCGEDRRGLAAVAGRCGGAATYVCRRATASCSMDHRISKPGIEVRISSGAPPSTHLRTEILRPRGRPGRRVRGRPYCP